jgi:hypothetical protein
MVVSDPAGSYRQLSVTVKACTRDCFCSSHIWCIYHVGAGGHPANGNNHAPRYWHSHAP